MILSKKPLTLAEVKEYLKDEEKTPILDYIKKFGKLSEEKAENIRKNLEKPNNTKIKEDHLVKILDFMPQDKEDINKILFDIGLTEEEEHAILEIVNKE